MSAGSRQLEDEQEQEREVIGSGADWAVVQMPSGVWLELSDLSAVHLPDDLGEILSASYEIGASLCED